MVMPYLLHRRLAFRETIEPPAAPTNLDAELVDPTTVDLTWEDNSEDETGFKIERKTGAGGEWGVIHTTGQDVEYWQDTEVPSASTLYYRVCAYNDGGDSDYSNEDSVDTPTPISITWFSMISGHSDTQTDYYEETLRTAKERFLEWDGVPPAEWDAYVVSTSPGGSKLDQDKTIQELGIGEGSTLYTGIW